MPKVGDSAPDFAARGARGDEIRLKDYAGKHHVVLFFYPKDMTSGWTNQLSAVRETIEQFRELDAIPFGVNPDDADSHLAFITAFNFPFDLLVDEDRRIATAYDVLKADGLGINRTVVAIGKDGRILSYERGAPPPGNILRAIRAASADG